MWGVCVCVFVCEVCVCVCVCVCGCEGWGFRATSLSRYLVTPPSVWVSGALQCCSDATSSFTHSHIHSAAVTMFCPLMCWYGIDAQNICKSYLYSNNVFTECSFYTLYSQKLSKTKMSRMFGDRPAESDRDNSLQWCSSERKQTAPSFDWSQVEAAVSLKSLFIFSLRSTTEISLSFSSLPLFQLRVQMLHSELESDSHFIWGSHWGLSKNVFNSRFLKS